MQHWHFERCSETVLKLAGANDSEILQTSDAVLYETGMKYFGDLRKERSWIDGQVLTIFYGFAGKRIQVIFVDADNNFKPECLE